MITFKVSFPNVLEESKKEKIENDLKKIERHLNDTSFLKFVTDQMSRLVAFKLGVKGTEQKELVKKSMAFKMNYFFNERGYDVSFDGGFVQGFEGTSDSRIFNLKRDFIKNFIKQTKDYDTNVQIEVVE